MISNIAERESCVDAILVHNRSRLFRNIYDSERYDKLLAQHGVKIISITRQFSNDTSGKMAKQFAAVFDEYHSSRTSVDVRRARAHLISNGIWPGSFPPYGYKLEAVEQAGSKVRKKAVIDAETEGVVRLIYKLTLRGDGSGPPLGIKAVRNWLNKNGYRTREGACWSMQAIHRILTNTAYIGEFRFHERSSSDDTAFETLIYHAEPLIAREAFDEVQALLEMRAPSRHTKLISSPLLLAGIAFCQECGGAMSLRTGTGCRSVYRYYACNKRTRQGPIACQGATIPEHVLDEAVIQVIADRVLNPKRLTEMLSLLEQRHIKEANSSAATAQDIREKLQSDERKLQTLIAYAEGELKYNSTLKARMEYYNRQISVHRDELERLSHTCEAGAHNTSAQIKHFAEKIKRVLFGANKNITKIYLSMLIHRIEVSRDGITINGFQDALADAVANENGNANEPLDESRPTVRRYVRRWCRMRGSNPRPSVYKTAALPLC